MAGFVDWIPRIFLLGALLGAIGCLGRPDYNLPVFLFAYIAWNYMRVRLTRTKRLLWSQCSSARWSSTFSGWFSSVTRLGTPTPMLSSPPGKREFITALQSSWLSISFWRYGGFFFVWVLLRFAKIFRAYIKNDVNFYFFVFGVNYFIICKYNIKSGLIRNFKMRIFSVDSKWL